MNDSSRDISERKAVIDEQLQNPSIESLQNLIPVIDCHVLVNTDIQPLLLLLKKQVHTIVTDNDGIELMKVQIEKKYR